MKSIRHKIKHTKNFSIKNFGPPKAPPPPEILYVWVFFLYLAGKGGALEGGVYKGVYQHSTSRCTSM